MARILTLIVLGGLAAVSIAQQPEPALRDMRWFVERMCSLAPLPELEDSHTHLESTWDRSGGNEDGDDFKRIEGDRNILLDARGPGCVHRISTALLGAAVEGTRVRLFIDGSEEPLGEWTVQEFFTAPRTLCWPEKAPRGAGPYPGRFLPIPFARSCRLELTSDRERPRWGRYWQIAWTRYAAGTKVVSADADDLELSEEEADTAESALRRGGWPQREDLVVKRALLAPGKTLVLKGSARGIIRSMSINASPARPDVYRGLRMRAFWDGAEHPSLDAPAGYLFGNGEDLLTGVRTDLRMLGAQFGRISLPMPFTDGFVFRIENRNAEAVGVSLSLEVSGDDPGPDSGRLHATWREGRTGGADAPTAGKQGVPLHVALDREARGKYVGALLHVEWPWPGWWGEGDVLIWTDEEGFPPSYHGTGTEEYFNSAWCAFNWSWFGGALAVRPGDVLVASFHTNDAFNFGKRIRVAFETLGQGPADDLIRKHRPIWGTTAYWYADRALPAGSTEELLPRRAHPPLVHEWIGGFEPVQRGGAVRFTSDGSEPTAESPEWTVNESHPGKTLRARTFHPHLPPSRVVHIDVPADADDPRPWPAVEAGELERGYRYACYLGDFDDVPDTAKLKAARRARTRSGSGLKEFVAAHAGEGIAVRTQGFIRITDSDSYLFDLNGAEFARLTLDGRVLVGPGIYRSSSWPPCALVSLAAGAHEVVIESLVHPKVDRLALHVTTPDGTRRPVNLQRERR